MCIFLCYFRVERSIVQTRANAGKLLVVKSSTSSEPSTPSSIAKSATASPASNHVGGGQKAGNEEFNKEKAEQDLRLQRAALNQKRAIEMQKNRGGKWQLIVLVMRTKKEKKCPGLTILNAFFLHLMTSFNIKG